VSPYRIWSFNTAIYELPFRAYTGYIDFDAKHLFFYFFESRNDPDRDDVIFWTNGGEASDYRVYAVLDHIESPFLGPGCSSSLGLFMELGTLESSLYDNYL
jgi:hypothetical protein